MYIGVNNMKKNINKKVVGIVAIIVIIVAIAGVFYIKNKSQANVANAKAATAIATVRKATFGSVVNVTLTEAGKKQYIGAIKYRVFYEGKAITQEIELGKPTTAFPIRKKDDKVVVKLSKADKKEAYSVDLELQEEKK
ncbi:MAG: hypothetical protein ACI8WT_003606 [Clostridium sp.]|jgi:hypothetical protein